MDPNRQFWNGQQQALRQALLRSDDHQRAIELFLSQHAMVHAAGMSQTEAWSFDDEVWQDLAEPAVRSIPPNGEHSIAWVIWHIARVEDITLNLLIAGSPQVLVSGNWLEQMKVAVCDTGNAMDPRAVMDLSADIDIQALRGYRSAVGRRTREIVQQLQPQELKHKIEPSCLRRVLAEGAVTGAAGWLVDYWGGLKIAELLLMPPTRHNFVHLNEALRAKQKTHKFKVEAK